MTAPPAGALPPLPEPDFLSGNCNIGESAYTADQMREYALLAALRLREGCGGLVALAESRHVRVLRELRDTGDVSDWRAMETALTAAIEALAAPAASVEARPAATSVVPDAWDAIVESCMVTEAVTPVESDPRGTINRLIDYHVQMNAAPAAPKGEDEAMVERACSEYERWAREEGRYADNRGVAAGMRGILTAALNPEPQS